MVSHSGISPNVRIVLPNGDLTVGQTAGAHSQDLTQDNDSAHFFCGTVPTQQFHLATGAESSVSEERLLLTGVTEVNVERAD